MKKYNEFLLEKRIDQISTSVEVTFSIDIIKTTHTHKIDMILIKEV